MLGAQTRAAEYNAAKKAQARQASREAEEQKAPPPAAPISLGAFTKPVSSRNKGAKTYVPLILAPTPEADRENEDSEYVETPTKKPPAPSPSSNCSGSRLGDNDASTLRRIGLNGSDPPSAPRSMVESHSGVIQSTPGYGQRPQSIPAYHHNHPQMQQQLMISPYPFQFGVHGPVVAPPEFAWPPHLSSMMQSYPLHHAALQHQSQAQIQPQPRSHTQMPPLIFDSPARARQSAPARTEPPVRRPVEIRQPSAKPVEVVSQETARPVTPEENVKGFVWGPDDLSPSKQEVKLSSLSKQLKIDKERRQVEDSQLRTIRSSDGTETQVPVPIRLREPLSNSHQARSSMMENHVPTAVTPVPRPMISERYDSQQSILSQPCSIPNPLRQFRGVDSYDDEPVTAVPWMKSGNTGENVWSAESDTQYDRAAKMQKFAAVQQSLNKQGKTVLNNPERKSTASVVSQVPSIIVDSTGGPGPAMPEELTRDLPTAKPQPSHAAVHPPPGLEKPENPFVPAADDDIFEVVGNAELHKEFVVGTADWLELRPPTSAYRKKMQSVMNGARQEYFNRKPRQVADKLRWSTEGQTQAFVDQDTRWNLPARERIHAIAEDYSMRWHTASGQPRPGYREVDLPAGMIRGAGNMIVNLSEYWYAKKEEPDYFNKTKKVPDAALDWDCLQSGYTCKSLFGPDCSTFGRW
jgi:hypothetical protein